MNPFPSVYVHEQLCENDFIRFSLPFSRILKKKIPTVSKIAFISDAEITKGIRNSQIDDVRQLLLRTQSDPDTISIRRNGFLLPFSVTGATIIAVVSGVDPFVVEKADPGWLVEVRNSALKEFILLKQERVDWDTGLLNAANLYDILHFLCDSAGADLMLVELYPKVRSSREAIVNARNAALSLVNFSDNRFPVHYLGHGLFALVSEHARSMSRVGTMLLSWLRREGFVRVHIGYSGKEQPESIDNTEKILFDEAWQALQVAGKRGPYSFCDFSLLAHPEQHPLSRPPRRVVAKLSRRWKDADRFALVQIQCDMDLAKTLSAVLGMSETVVCDNEDIYIFLGEKDSRQAQTWVKRKLSELKKKIPIGKRFLVGIGAYPFADFSKSEVLCNCRKAVLHASFYGSGGVAVFDAISLNISGDVYYQEGDLANAIREYKKGLICEENNINLLNSLGVAYAMMEKHRPAHQCFNKVLTIDSDNFMALYNLGFGEKYLGMNESAILRFERALAVGHQDDEKGVVQKDIQLQLGKLYCLTDEYQRAIDILLPWYEEKKPSKKAGYACRFLGKSFHGLKDNTQAMVWLQRALQFDGFDAESMGLLGEIYLEQGEGDEIALSLCEKSVEIDPIDLHLKLRFGKVLISCGKFNEAKNILRLCLRNKGTKTEAELQIGLIYLLEGRSKKASSWFSKVLNGDDATETVIQQARYFLETEGHE